MIKTGWRCWIVMGALLWACAGCATRLQTPSGGPEITVHGVGLERVKEAFCNDLASRGYAISRHEGAVVEADKNGDVADNIFFGTLAHPNTQKRVVLNFLPARDGGIRVLFHGYNRSASFGDMELKGGWARIQYEMECVAAELEGRARPSAPPVEKGPRVSARN